jgi:hypothetical protein
MEASSRTVNALLSKTKDHTLYPSYFTAWQSSIYVLSIANSTGSILANPKTAKAGRFIVVNEQDILSSLRDSANFTNRFVG